MDGPLKKGDRKIIAAQGPLDLSVGHFWRMINEQNVTLIVTTCNLTEGSRVKCAKFWPEPSSDSLDFQHLFDDKLEGTNLEVE